MMPTTPFPHDPSLAASLPEFMIFAYEDDDDDLDDFDDDDFDDDFDDDDFDYDDDEDEDY